MTDVYARANDVRTDFAQIQADVNAALARRDAIIATKVDEVDVAGLSVTSIAPDKHIMAIRSVSFMLISVSSDMDNWSFPVVTNLMLKGNPPELLYDDGRCQVNGSGSKGPFPVRLSGNGGRPGSIGFCTELPKG